MKETSKGTLYADTNVKVYVPAVTSVHLPSVIRAYERRFLETYIFACQGNIRKMSRMLGVPHTHIYKRLARYELTELLKQTRAAAKAMNPVDPGGRDGFNT